MGLIRLTNLRKLSKIYKHKADTRQCAMCSFVFREQRKSELTCCYCYEFNLKRIKIRIVLIEHMCYTNTTQFKQNFQPNIFYEKITEIYWYQTQKKCGAEFVPKINQFLLKL